MYRKLILLTAVLTFGLIVLGAYVRLSDAGLGCPDWPGCYGHLSPHHAAEQISEAHDAAPNGPVSAAKAWKEMIHRYLATFVGLLIVTIMITAWRKRRHLEQAPWLATLLVGVVVLQGMFGKWTVTMLLKPAIVTGHLIGGMTTLSLLVWLALRQMRFRPVELPAGMRLAAAVGLLLVACQIVLGGWVSTNYAALACSDLPTCRGAFVPPGMDFADAFHVVRELGHTEDGALLSIDALTAIHWTHRVGAIVVLTYVSTFAFSLLRVPELRRLALVLLAAVSTQFCLGLANVWFSLPLPVAAAHNAGAALLLVLFVIVNFRLGARAPSLGYAGAFA